MGAFFILKTGCIFIFFVYPYFCNMNSDTGKWLIIIGILIIVAGLAIYFYHDKLHWIGRLPGDIRVEKENFRFYFPVTTMIIFSLVLTAIIAVFKKFF
jgi:hypothetical protein